MLQLLYALRLAVHKHNCALVDDTTFLSLPFLEYATSADATIINAYSNVKSSTLEDDGDDECLHSPCRSLRGHCGLMPTLAESVCCREIEKKQKTLNCLCSMPDRVRSSRGFLGIDRLVLFMEQKSVSKAYWKYNFILMYLLLCFCKSYR